MYQNFDDEKKERVSRNPFNRHILKGGQVDPGSKMYQRSVAGREKLDTMLQRLWNDGMDEADVFMAGVKALTSRDKGYVGAYLDSKNPGRIYQKNEAMAITDQVMKDAGIGSHPGNRLTREKDEEGKEKRKEENVSRGGYGPKQAQGAKAMSVRQQRKQGKRPSTGQPVEETDREGIADRETGPRSEWQNTLKDRIEGKATTADVLEEFQKQYQSKLSQSPQAQEKRDQKTKERQQKMRDQIGEQRDLEDQEAAAAGPEPETEEMRVSADPVAIGDKFKELVQDNIKANIPVDKNSLEGIIQETIEIMEDDFDVDPEKAREAIFRRFNNKLIDGRRIEFDPFSAPEKPREEQAVPPEERKAQPPSAPEEEQQQEEETVSNTKKIIKEAAANSSSPEEFKKYLMDKTGQFQLDLGRRDAKTRIAQGAADRRAQKEEALRGKTEKETQKAQRARERAGKKEATQPSLLTPGLKARNFPTPEEAPAQKTSSPGGFRPSVPKQPAPGGTEDPWEQEGPAPEPTAQSPSPQQALSGQPGPKGLLPPGANRKARRAEKGGPGTKKRANTPRGGGGGFGGARAAAQKAPEVMRAGKEAQSLEDFKTYLYDTQGELFGGKGFETGGSDNPMEDQAPNPSARYQGEPIEPRPGAQEGGREPATAGRGQTGQGSLMKRGTEFTKKPGARGDFKRGQKPQPAKRSRKRGVSNSSEYQEFAQSIRSMMR